MLTATRAPELFLALGVWELPMNAWDWWPPENRALAVAYGRSADPEATAEAFNRMILGDARWEQLPEGTRDRLRAEGEAFRADMASQDVPCFEIDQLQVPRLLGCGTVLFDSSFAGVYARAAEETGCELLVIDGADHFAPINHPDAWARFVRATVELAGRANRAER